MKDRQRRLFLVICALLGMLILTFAGCKKTSQDEQPELPDSGAEAGTYYFDPGSGDEYLMTLGGKSAYTLTVSGSTESGTYTLDGSTLTLKKGEATRTAAYEGNVLTLDYDGAQLRFLKKVSFTVSFDTVGGSAVESKSVLNGKSLSAPEIPTRDGYVFIGWYSDEAYKTPFTFDATPVTGDLTLRARWAEKPAGSLEYRISYDLGYEGETIADAETIGGKLYNAAVPAAREGYTFVGWWVSMTNESGKLSYRFVEGSENDGTVFTADTTLFAVWQQTNATFAVPAVSVSDTAISWDSVGAAAYLVKITAPDGSVMVDNQRTTTTVFQVSFAMAGNYRIEVTAVDAGGNAVSETAVRVYTNKALDRVGGFTVIDPSVLVFRGVAGAEKYLITVSCGNAEHQHKAFDNGLALYFNFANCEMKAGGITFTVTAVANGYASSSATFVYERNLDAVGGLKVTDDVLSWNPVTGATSYLVTVGDKTYTVLGNSFSLAAFADATYSISVTPVAHGFNSPAAATASYEKKSPAVPENVRLVGTVLTWDAIPGATSYEVRLGDKTLTVEAGKTELDLADAVTFAEGADYTLTLKVTGANGSAEKQLTARYNAMNPLLTYSQSILRWTPVIGALTYEVQINGVTVATIDNGDSFFKVTSFTQAGENTVRVRFNNGVYDSEWVELTVTAHKVTLDGRGGSTVESLYKAVGDLIELPALTKSGYDFSAWYNLPGGAESNGRKYTDAYFVESGETVLYAYYTPKAYTIHYNTGDNTDETDTVYFGKSYQLKVPTSALGTRAFGGWFSAPYGAGIAYTDAEGNSLNPWNFVDDNVTVYAFWVDQVLRYEKIGNAYAVSKGARIDLVTSVTVPATYNGLPVTEIISGAFENCQTLTEIRLPDTLTRIAADTAFAGCENLKSVTVYTSGESKYSRYSSADGVLFDSGDSSAPHAPRPVLMPMAKTGSYTVPSGVDMIPRSAFAGSKLSKIVLPVSVTEIGTEAFADCSELVSIVFEEAGATNGVKPLAIGDRAFLNCTGLTVIALPARLQSISLTAYAYLQNEMVFTNTPSAFEGCENLTDVVVAKGQSAAFTSVDGVLFGENGTALVYFPAAKSAENYQIPAGVTKIGDSAFLAVSGLRGSLELPGRVTVIGTAAFANCRYLTSVTFKEGISNVEIGDYAFFATDISTITFEAGSRVTKIGNGAFKKDENFSASGEIELIIPSTVTSIGDEAFYGFGEMNVEIKEGTSTLSFGNNVFYGCEIGTLNIPKNVTALANFFTGMSVEEIVVAEGNQLFLSIDGVLYTKDASGNPATLLIFPSGKHVSDFTVPDGVTAIADGAFKGNDWVEEITLPASLTKIGQEAFAGCSELTTVTFTQSTGSLTIGAYAFHECSYLESVELPKGVSITIGAYAFANTSRLKTLTLGNVVSIGDHAFEKAAYYGSLKLVFPATLTTIGNYAFKDACLDSATFEGTSALKTIGAYAFSGVSFSTFTVPASVESIAAYAFSDNYYLTTLNFEDGDKALVIGVSYDGQYGTHYGNILNGSTYVTELHLPGRLTVIERESFYGLYKLKTVTFGSEAHPSRLTTIGDQAFCRSGLTAVTIPASVKNTADAIAIGAEAFAYADLESLTFEMGGSADTAPLTIGEDAFGYLNVEEVVLPARLASFTDANGNVTAPLANGREVFGSYIKRFTVSGDGTTEYKSYDGLIYNADMTELIFCPEGMDAAVTIPASVKKISARAFYNCRKLPAVTFAQGSACEEIGESAFGSCVLLESVVLPDTVASIGEDAFMSCSAMTAFTIPAALQSFDASLLNYCTGLQNLYVSANNTLYQSIGGVLFSKDGKTLIYYLPTRTDTSYTVPEGTEEIASGAFNSNKALQSVTIPASVKLIDRSAFQSCTSLAAVNFTAGGTEALVIGYQAFAYTALNTVKIPARTASINEYAFSRTSLASVTFEDGSKLSYIGDGAFSRTNLTVVTLPLSLREMGNSVFANCTMLTTATLPEGLISVGESLFENDTALVTVNLPATLQKLGNLAFQKCSALKSVNFAKNSVIEVLYVGTFYGCSALESIELPASLTEIPDKDPELWGSQYEGLFTGCSSLKRVVFAEGSKLTKIGTAAFKKTALESITFPSSLSTIGEEAFAYTNLTSLSIPVTVTSLGDRAFQGCENLISVSLGSGVKVLPSGLFANCTGLTSFTIPASVISIESNAFNHSGITAFAVDAASESFVALDGVVYDSSWNLVLFPDTKTSLTIPAGTTKLPEDFFEDYNIVSVSVEEGNTAFREVGGVLYDAGMTTIVYFADSVTSYEIPEQIPSSMSEEDFFEMLGNAKNLTEITVAAGNTSYQAKFGVVYDMDWNIVFFPMGRTEFIIPKEVTDLTGYGVFYGSALKTVTFEEGRTENLTLGKVSSYYGIFYGASNLEYVTLPEGTVSMARGTFMGCSALKVVNLPASLTSIANDTSMFSSAKNLEAINVADGNTAYLSIDGILFKADMSLVCFPATKTTFVIPAKMTTLPSLSSAANLTTVTFEKAEDGSEVTLTLDSSAFKGLTKLVSVALPGRVKGVTSKMFEGCTALTSLTFGESETYKTDAQGVVYERNETGWTLLMIPAGVRFDSYEIPADVTKIMGYVFVNTGVKTITSAARADGLALELAKGEYTWDSKNYVYYYTGVFASCKQLTSVTLPDTVTKLPDGTFYGCSALETLTLPSGLTEIGAYAFNGCTSLKTLVLPASLKTIGDYAFEGCTALTELVVPASVTTIGYYAFASWTADQTIKVAFAEDNRPEGVDSNWLGYRNVVVKVVYNYTAA